MKNIEIDYSSLEKALSKVIGALAYYNSDLAKTDSKLAEYLRGGVIQSFEFTY